ncbi:outer membrane lipoprotein carrier protein LolA [Lutimaribacter sp. EGI FJ00015]|uniref:Outer membrane lipoprotein carrier protein LolA n=1 Tax=Lutimaribacter degradans TaxID=2945989 RepID=A0ACC5ZWU6_9RHOB|nr:outer membrane lipoprotein carrier protein LolA [Lutimaribacter sp. EGI FJ00013]MCM2562823.1 outer membrane lipoprotein carrier protein LolA [Lutimaribacter sp. EGI FJ00013]MCO0613980.1 outer membrane lipoprotein carrier protein LolA [Lutimaribacter sp. EGI FJ00015]MCO0636952.1 outer membrane lipoprotein carrier protein LolA [Lutimaribacter sp. EGI FJ00014]
MMLLRSLIAAALLAVTALPAAAEKLSLAEISRYLNDLQTAQGAFTQINDDGTIDTGTIYIKRPGRVRFEYAAPNPALVLAGAGSVAVFDARSNTGPDVYPLKQTPLSIILDNNVDLTRARMVVGHTSDGTTTTVTAQDPDNPEYGNIQLVFTANPTELRQWKINDDAGGTTTVVLGEMRVGGSISNRKFDIQSETRDRTNR